MEYQKTYLFSNVLIPSELKFHALNSKKPSAKSL